MMSSQKIIILTTVGKSLLVNFSRQLEKPEADVLKASHKELINLIAKMGYDRASAETNSIVKILDLIKKERKVEDDQFVLYFLHSETKEGRFCSSILEEYFKSKGYLVVDQEIKGLKYDSKEFESIGLKSLIEEVIGIIRESKRDGDDVVINATAGFKVESAYLTLIGTLFQCEIFYIHELFRELIRIPKLPITLNKEFFEKYKAILSDLKLGIDRMELNKKYGELPQDLVLLTEIVNEDNREIVTLNVAGRLLALLFEEF